MTAGRKPHPWTDAELAELQPSPHLRAVEPAPATQAVAPCASPGQEPDEADRSPGAHMLPEPLLTVRQLAELLDVSEVHVRRHASELGGVHLPGRGTRPGPLRFHWPTVTARLEQQAQDANVGWGSQRSRRPETTADAGLGVSRPVPRPGTRVRLLPDKG